MTTIQILVTREADRDAFKELLPSQYEIEQGSEVCDAALYLVEESILPEYEDTLRQQIDDTHPVFCPIIVVQNPNTLRPPSLPADSEADSPVLVDDILRAPVTRQSLRKRVESLLKRRSQSREVSEQLAELEEKNHQIEQIVSVISHDLRNPLNVAQGRIDISRTDADNEHLATATNALERMETLISEVLTMSRQGAEVEETTRVTLADLVEECWQSVATKDANVVVDDDLVFRADPDRCRHLFENLFRNAVEHGGAAVTIRIGTFRDEDGFYVEDDGPGIAQEDRELVFERGYTTGDDGTGLGLSIVEGIVSAHDWTARITTGRDGGLRFEVSNVVVVQSC